MRMTYLIILKLIFFPPIIKADTQNSVSNKESPSAMDFLRQKAIETKNEKYIYNKYETIIGGGLGILAGTIGYFTTKNKILQIAYSGIQTVGILNVGTGTYNLLSPTYEASLYNLGKRIEKGENPVKSQSLANHYILYKAKEERAFKYSLMMSSGLLSAQYFSNVLYADVHPDLKRIYLFLGGVNILVTGFSVFYQGDYMSRVEEWKISLIPDSRGPGIGLFTRF